MTTRDSLIDTLYDGRYRIVKRVGAGGMANVYCAEDETLGRQVAIKVLNSRYAEDDQFVERFLREASSAARLNHPNIVQVYDRGEGEGTYYIAMEFVDGMTLKQLITSRGALTEDEVLAYGRQALHALRFAHRNGVVHRDVKPHNMMVDNEGRLKIADFGIARAGADSGLTEVGSIVGTAQYLSPEQARGEHVSASSDLYSLGVVMFEMVTGRVPFDGESPVNVALKHVNDPVPRPSSIRPVSAPLEAIILRCMQKDPTLRYQTADELLADLDAARNGEIGAETAALTRVLPAATGATTTVLPQGGLVPPPPRDVGNAYANAQFEDEYYEEDDVAERESRKLWPWLVLLGMLVLLAIVGYAMLGGGKEVATPDVVGATQDQARERLADAGLKVGEIDEKFSSKPVGTVTAQDPGAGEKVDEGSSVNLVVSLGVKNIIVPDVIGMTADDARQAISEAGFPDARVREVFSEKTEGDVVAQDPPADTEASPDTLVTINVSKGAKNVPVAAVVGLQEAEATATLKEDGFAVTVRQAKDGATPEGEVVSQTPAADSLVTGGSTVTIYIATGYNIVPDVIGDSSEDAQAELQDAGFKVQLQESEDPTLTPGDTPRATASDPASGSRLQLGETVVLTVSTPPAEAAPPGNNGNGNGNGNGNDNP